MVTGKVHSYNICHYCRLKSLKSIISIKMENFSVKENSKCVFLNRLKICTSIF